MARTTSRPTATPATSSWPSSPGSFLVESDGADSSEEYLAAVEQYADSGGVPYNARSYEQIAGYYEGLELVEPGIVPIPDWRPDETVFSNALDVDEMGGVGRKP